VPLESLRPTDPASARKVALEPPITAESATLGMMVTKVLGRSLPGSELLDGWVVA
jgi:hypothetical protein